MKNHTPTVIDPDDCYLRPSEVAERIGTTRQSVYRFARRGLLPRPHKVGHLTLWSWREVKAAIEQAPRLPARRAAAPEHPDRPSPR